MAVISMSTQEFNRLEVLLGVQSGRLRVADASRLIGVGRRQVLRLLRGLREDGASSLISQRRGRPSNHRVPQAVRELAVRLVRERYRDFGPTLAAEKLAAVHGCTVSRETLRQWMIAEELWVDRRHRLPSPHQPRRRRECLGELVQISRPAADSMAEHGDDFGRPAGAMGSHRGNAWQPLDEYGAAIPGVPTSPSRNPDPRCTGTPWIGRSLNRRS